MNKQVSARNQASQQADLAVETAESILSTKDVAPFSKKAYTALQRRIGEYIKDLVDQSVVTAERHSADTISEVDVNRAADYLANSKISKTANNVGTVGGILLGASLSNGLAIMTGGQFTATGMGVSFALAIVGAFMVAWQIARQ